MDKPAVAHGRIMNATLLAFLAFDTGLISGFVRCLETLTEFIGSLRLEALGLAQRVATRRSLSRDEFYLDADSESKVYGFRLHQLRTGLL